MRTPHSEACRHLRCFAVQQHGWSSSGLAAHFKIPPADAAAHARADRLHARFFGSETRSEALHVIRFGLAVADFGGGEDALEKAFAEPLDGLPDAWHFDDIDARTYDHCLSLPAMKAEGACQKLTCSGMMSAARFGVPAQSLPAASNS